MNKLFYIFTIIICFLSMSATANDGVSQYIKSKRAKAQQMQNLSNKQIAYYKHLKAQGKPILASMNYTIRLDETNLAEQDVQSPDMGFEEIQTASGDNENAELPTKTRAAANVGTEAASMGPSSSN